MSTSLVFLTFRKQITDLFSQRVEFSINFAILKKALQTTNSYLKMGSSPSPWLRTITAHVLNWDWSASVARNTDGTYFLYLLSIRKSTVLKKYFYHKLFPKTTWKKNVMICFIYYFRITILKKCFYHKLMMINEPINKNKLKKVLLWYALFTIVESQF